MNALICERCGGTINPETMQCEYCDTRYMDNSRINSLIIERMELEKENERLRAARYMENLYLDGLRALRRIDDSIPRMFDEGILSLNECRSILNLKEV